MGTSDTLMYLASEKNVECIYYQHWLSVVLFGTENSYWHNNVEPKHLQSINFTCLPKVKKILAKSLAYHAKHVWMRLHRSPCFRKP